MKRSTKFVAKILGKTFEQVKQAIEELEIEPDSYSSYFGVPTYNDETQKKLAYHLGTNIDWCCDNCDASLNSQIGFDARKGTWKCKKCGYINSTTEDDVIWDD